MIFVLEYINKQNTNIFTYNFIFNSILYYKRYDILLYIRKYNLNFDTCNMKFVYIPFTSKQHYNIHYNLPIIQDIMRIISLFTVSSRKLHLFKYTKQVK